MGMTLTGCVGGTIGYIYLKDKNDESTINCYDLFAEDESHYAVGRQVCVRLIKKDDPRIQAKKLFSEDK